MADPIKPNEPNKPAKQPKPKKTQTPKPVEQIREEVRSEVSHPGQVESNQPKPYEVHGNPEESYDPSYQEPKAQEPEKLRTEAEWERFTEKPNKPEKPRDHLTNAEVDAIQAQASNPESAFFTRQFRHLPGITRDLLQYVSQMNVGSLPNNEEEIVLNIQQIGHMSDLESLEESREFDGLPKLEDLSTEERKETLFGSYHLVKMMLQQLVGTFGVPRELSHSFRVNALFVVRERLGLVGKEQEWVNLLEDETGLNLPLGYPILQQYNEQSKEFQWEFTFDNTPLANEVTDWFIDHGVEAKKIGSRFVQVWGIENMDVPPTTTGREGKETPFKSLWSRYTKELNKRTDKRGHTYCYEKGKGRVPCVHQEHKVRPKSSQPESPDKVTAGDLFTGDSSTWDKIKDAFSKVQEGKERASHFLRKFKIAALRHHHPLDRKRFKVAAEVISKVEHLVMTGFRKAKEMVEETAKIKGASEKTAATTAKVLSTLDLVTAWTVNMPVTGALTGNVWLAKASSWIPVASLAYLAFSTVTNPIAVQMAADQVLSTRSSKERRGLKRLDSDQEALLEFLDECDKAKNLDWGFALVMCALDKCNYNLKEAIEMAREHSDQPSSKVERKSLDNKREVKDENGGLIPDNPHVARRVDLVTLPKNIPGTRCDNCVFIREGDKGKHYCSHPELHNQAVNNRMCCSLWNGEGTLRHFSPRKEPPVGSQKERELVETSSKKNLQGEEKAMSSFAEGTGGALLGAKKPRVKASPFLGRVKMAKIGPKRRDFREGDEIRVPAGDDADLHGTVEDTGAIGGMVRPRGNTNSGPGNHVPIIYADNIVITREGPGRRSVTGSNPVNRQSE